MPYPNGIAVDYDFTGGALPAGWVHTRASAATDSFWTDAPGSTYNTYANNAPRFSSNGIVIEGARTNYLLNSTAPATQTVSLTVGTTPIHTLWVIGTGSCTVTAGTGAATGLGTATNGNPVTFTVTTAGTFVFTVTGTLNRFQVEKWGSASSFIVTAGAAATRVNETCAVPLGGWFNAAAGTYSVEVSWPTLAGLNAAATQALAIDDGLGGTANRYQLGSSAGAIGQQLAYSGSVAQVNEQVYSLAANSIMRLVGRYNSVGGALRFAVMGTLYGVNDTGKTLPTGLVQMSLSGGFMSTTRIKRVQYFPYAMSDADLTAASQYPPLAQLAMSGRGVGMGTARANARVRPGIVGLGSSSGRMTPYTFSTARPSMSGLGVSAGGALRASVFAAPPPRVVVPPPDVAVFGYDTLLLDRDLWDLCVDAYGNIAAAQAPYAVEQDVASAIRLFLGELWYDTTKGIPYFEEVLGHAPPLPVLKAMIEQAALSVPAVAQARAFVTEMADRTLRGQVQIVTTAGQTIVLNETFLGGAP